MNDKNKQDLARKELDEQLKKTEIGEFILKYKAAFICFIAFVLIALVSFGVNRYMTEKRNNKLSEKIYNFEKTEFQSYKDKKLALNELVSKFKVLLDESSSFSGVVALNIEICDELVDGGNLNEAKELLELGSKSFAKKNSFIGHFYNSRLANVYEDLKNFKGAIGVLETMTKEKIKLLEWKTYLDLGRMYMKVGNKKMAESSFRFVVENYNEEEYSKMAKLYLKQIEKK